MGSIGSVAAGLMWSLSVKACAWVVQAVGGVPSLGAGEVTVGRAQPLLLHQVPLLIDQRSLGLKELVLRRVCGGVSRRLSTSLGQDPCCSLGQWYVDGEAAYKAIHAAILGTPNAHA